MRSCNSRPAGAASRARRYLTAQVECSRVAAILNLARCAQPRARNVESCATAHEQGNYKFAFFLGNHQIYEHCSMRIPPSASLDSALAAASDLTCLCQKSETGFLFLLREALHVSLVSDRPVRCPNDIIDIARSLLRPGRAFIGRPIGPIAAPCSKLSAFKYMGRLATGLPPDELNLMWWMAPSDGIECARIGAHCQTGAIQR